MKDTHPSKSNPFEPKDHHYTGDDSDHDISNDSGHDASNDADTEILNAAEITTMAYAVPLMPLPSSLKSRLMARLNLPEPLPEWIKSSEFQQILREPIDTLIAIAHSIDRWKPFLSPSGATFARWKVDAKNKQVAFFLKVPTPGTLPRHRHATGEVILVLEGDFTADGQTHRSGARAISNPNTIHQPTTQGCLVLCISSLEDKVLEA